MPHERRFTLEVDGRLLHGISTTPEASGRHPAVVICHGFKGFMSWGFFPYLARQLAASGFCALRFNFSGSGMGPGDELVTDEEAFRSATFTKDLAELRCVIDGVGRSIASRSADPEKIALLGHSRGGGIALLAAADWAMPIRALVTWAAVSTFDRLKPDEREQWRRTGVLGVVNSRTGQRLEIGTAVLVDLETHAQELDLTAAAARRVAPWLIVHGCNDETVPFDEAQRLLATASGEVSLCSIRKGDHTFGVRHPFKGPTPAFKKAILSSLQWLERTAIAGDR